jgi:hypothetical protein
MTFAFLPITLLLTALPVHVEAELCPSGREIETALASLLPASPNRAPPDLARVFRQGKLLRIELVDKNGALIGERSLDDSDRCAELAVQVAVVIASLATDVHPEFSRPAPEVPPPLPAPPPAPPPVYVPLPRPAPRASFDLAAGASLSFPGSVAVGGSFAAIWIPRTTGLGVRLSAGTETTRSIELGEGRQATWRRWTATSEGDWRYCRGALVLDVHAGLAWTLLHADGSGFPSNASDSSFAPGTYAGARLSWWPTTHVATWLGLDGTYWLLRQLVTATVDTPGQQVPRFSAMASLGLALGRSAKQPLGSVGPAAQ